MFGIIKKLIILRKPIINNDYLMIYPYKISVNRYIGSCNDKEKLLTKKNELKILVFIKVVNVNVY